MSSAAGDYVTVISPASLPYSDASLRPCIERSTPAVSAGLHFVLSGSVAVIAPCWKRLCHAPVCLTITLICLVLHLAPAIQPLAEFQFGEFRFDRPLSLLTCHWLHWSASHLIWDLAVFICIGSLCENSDARSFRRTLLISSIVVPLLVLISAPELQCYRGLSGLDSALFGLLVTRLLWQSVRRGDRRGTGFYAVFLVAQFLKILAETKAQGNLFVTNGDFVPVPLAHLVGAVIGCCFGGLTSIRAEVNHGVTPAG